MAESQDMFDPIVMADERSDAIKVLLSHGSASSTVVPVRKTASDERIAVVSVCRGFRSTHSVVGSFVLASQKAFRRKVKVLESLIGMIQKFPYDDPTYDKLHEDLDRIRGKFKQFCSLLNVQPDFKISAEGPGLSF